MAIVKKILSDKWYYYPGSPEIIQSEWDPEKKKEYFKTHYNPPPLDCPQEEAAGFLLGSLTRKQYMEHLGIQLNYGLGSLWVEHVLRHGVHDWRGWIREKTENGEQEVIRPVYEEGPFGRRLTAESYEDLVFFCESWISVVANQIITMSELLSSTSQRSPSQQ